MLFILHLCICASVQSKSTAQAAARVTDSWACVAALPEDRDEEPTAGSGETAARTEVRQSMFQCRACQYRNSLQVRSVCGQSTQVVCGWRASTPLKGRVRVCGHDMQTHHECSPCAWSESRVDSSAGRHACCGRCQCCRCCRILCTTHRGRRSFAALHAGPPANMASASMEVRLCRLAVMMRKHLLEST